MNSPTMQFVPSSRMGTYESIQQIGIWGDFIDNSFQDMSNPMIVEVDTKLDNQSEGTSHESLEPPHKFGEEATRPVNKVLRRLAQNREAARKSRLRKKAYVQQLETSRLRLIQLEQELEQAKKPGQNLGAGLNANPQMTSGGTNAGIAAFQAEYGQWVEEQNRRVSELKTALDSQMADTELCILVDGVMKHYSKLFRMKETAAQADIFYVMSGLWKTSAERFFLWIGGFRPSEILKVLVPQLDDLSEQQIYDVCSLTQSCQQAEDALSQGMDKLQQTVVDTISAAQLGEGSQVPQLNIAMERLEALASFLNQADHLRQESLLQMSRILTTRQSAKSLLALGEYCERLRTLTSLWSTRSREPV